MKTLTDNLNNGILPIAKQTLNQLQLKNSKGKEANHEILLASIPEQRHPVNLKALTKKRKKSVIKSQSRTLRIGYQ